MDDQIIETIATSLYEAKQSREPIPPLMETYPDLNVEDAYKVQLMNVNRELGMGHSIIGRKIGLTSKAMQQQFGMSESDYGVLLDNMLADQEVPIAIERFIQPKVEVEVAFILKSRLKGPGITPPNVLQATEGIMPAFEIIDSRIKDWKIGLVDTIADNASSAMVVLGNTLTEVRAIDLRTVGMVLEHNGRIVATAASAESLGNPVNAVVWLANKLATYGQSLEAGEIILSGALTRAMEIAPGDVFCGTFANLGSVKSMFKSATTWFFV